MPDRPAKVVLRPDQGFVTAGRTFMAFFGALALALGLIGETTASSAALLIAAATFAGFKVASVAWRLLATKEIDDAVLAVEGRDLVVELGANTRHRLLGASITTGYVVAEGARGGKLVLFQERMPAIHATFPELADARAVLGELGLSPLERPVTFAFFFGMRVTVGIDGVLVEWPLLRRKRFVPHRRIDDVRWTDEEVTLLLIGGDRYVIATNPGRDAAGRERHEALVERLLAAREAYRASDGGTPIGLLARQGRSTEAWVKDLRSLGEASGGQYRSASLPAEALWRIALDPAEKEELRVGAGLALRSALDEDGRSKLRVAAEASASPKVRVALAAAAETVDDGDVARAIDGEQAIAHRE